MPELLIIRDYISADYCKILIEAIEKSTPRAVVNTPRRKEIPASMTRFIPPQGFEGEIPAFALVSVIRSDVKQRLTDFYKIPEPIYDEYTLLTDLSGGDFHPLHADNEMLKDGVWVPNHTPYRNYTAMLYLNMSGKDFQGGHIVFPELKMDVPPEAGLLVGFKCDHEYVHQTTPVTEGHRLALSLWMTGDKTREEKWD